MHGVAQHAKPDFEATPKTGRHCGRPTPLCVLLPIAVATLTLIAFIPALNAEFVEWGEEDVAATDMACRGLDVAGIVRIFRTFHAGRYQPLTRLTLLFDQSIWGPDPFGYHLGSVIIHVLNAVLFFAVARKLFTLNIPDGRTAAAAVAIAAASAAALFAIHPLRVESVAWIGARSDAFSAFFILFAVLLYLQAHQERQRGRSDRQWLIASVIAMALSVFAGNTFAAAAMVVLLLDVYPLRRLGGGPGRWLGTTARPVWREKLPFLVIALATAALTELARNPLVRTAGLPEHGLLQHVKDSWFGMSLGFCKTFWPADLSPLYSFSLRTAALGGVLLLGAGVTAWSLRRWWAGPLAAWMFYMLLLVPAFGRWGYDGAITADRSTYLACLGLAVVFGAIMLWCVGAPPNGPPRRTLRTSAVVLGVSIILGLSYRSSAQCKVWATPQSLWEHVVGIEPDCFIGRLYLGEELLRIQAAGAAEEFREAVRLCAASPRAHCGLGIALYRTGDAKAAAEAFERTLQLDPRNDRACLGLARALVDQNQLNAALEHLRTALTINPDNLEAYQGIGAILEKQGRLDAATAIYQEAIRRYPGIPVFYALAGSTLMDAGQYAEAAAVLRAGLQAADEAVEPANGLAWLMSVCPDAAHRDGKEAIRLAQYACSATLYQVPAYVDTLAAAYAEAGQFADAIEAQQRAISLAEGIETSNTIARFRERLGLFETHRPYRETQRRIEDAEGGTRR